MNKKLLLLILLILIVETFFEIKLKNEKILSQINRENIFINLTILKALEKDENLFNKVIKAIFEQYYDLKLISIIKNNRIVYYNTPDKNYNKIFLSLISYISKSDTTFLNHNLNYTKKILTFIASVKDLKIVKAFIIDTKFKIIIYIRNFLILFICSVIIFLIKKRSNTDIKSKSYVSIEEKIENSKINYDELYYENQKLAEEIENLTTFREIGLAINSILDFKQMLYVIMEVIIGKMEIRKIIIYLKDNESDELVAKIGREGNRIINEESLVYDRIIIGLGPIGKAMEFHTPIIINEENENILVTPLIAKGNIIGAIKVMDKINGGVFTENDKEFLRLLSAQIAIALNNAHLYEMAITDGLTKLYVHRHFQHKLNEEILRSKRNRKPLSLIMFDIDHFKKFNDTYGHQVGDYILFEIAKITKNMFRATDMVFRYGGEEFAVLLPETDNDDAYMLAEKLRENIANHIFKNNGIELSVTISLGVGTYYPDIMGKLKNEEFIKMVDEALYNSKNTGRNRTTLFTLNEKLFENQIQSPVLKFSSASDFLK